MLYNRESKQTMGSCKAKKTVYKIRHGVRASGMTEKPVYRSQIGRCAFCEKRDVLESGTTHASASGDKVWFCSQMCVMMLMHMSGEKQFDAVFFHQLKSIHYRWMFPEDFPRKRRRQRKQVDALEQEPQEMMEEGAIIVGTEDRVEEPEQYRDD